MNIISKTKGKISQITKDSKHTQPDEALTPEQRYERAYEEQLRQSHRAPNPSSRSKRKPVIKRSPPSFQRHGGSLNPAGNAPDSSVDVPPIPPQLPAHGDSHIVALDRFRMKTPTRDFARAGPSSGKMARKAVRFA
jgi:hypothetical protein